VTATARRDAAADTGGIESLYPFLYSGGGDLDGVLEEVRRSTLAKTQEIIELRAAVCERDADRLLSCAQALAGRFAAGGRLFAFGNGGSATDAGQVATLFLNPGGNARPLPAFGLANETAVVTALCNDIGPEVVFARQIAAFGRKGDIAVGLSTSGNSENLLRAFEEANRRSLLTIGIAGYQGGKMAEVAGLDYLFVVPSASVHRIQEAQTTIYHVLWELTLAALDGTAPDGTAPDGTAPDGTAPDGTAPGGTAPGGTAPGGTAPGGTAPGGTAPGGTAPGGTAPDGTAPDGTARDSARPDSGG
jgi:D-sedoheptulose 7-phosphate isomerase